MSSSLTSDLKGRRAAFFDVDDTLISVKSMFDFFTYWTQVKNLPDVKMQFEASFHVLRESKNPREVLNRLYYCFFAGHDLSELENVGRQWFNKNIIDKDFFIDKTLRRLRQHQNEGDLIVFISGSMLPLLQPIADYLNVEHILCTELLSNHQGILTGEIGDIQTIGQGKAVAMQQFAIRENIKMAESYAYGDDISDIGMLSATGNPVYVGNDLVMFVYAKEHYWEILL